MSYVLTLVGPDKGLSDEHVKECEEILKAENIDHPKCPKWLDDQKACDLFIAQKLSRSQLGIVRSKLASNKIDCFQVLAESRAKKILFADMDSTILAQETLDELAASLNLKDKISDITEKAMNGEIDFAEALKARVVMLKDLDIAALDKTVKELHFNKGAKTLIGTLKEAGIKTVLVSGGFHYFADWAAQECGFDHVHANRARIEDNSFTGDVREPILDAQTKEDLVIHYTRIYGFDDSESVAVGDGANDLKMLKRAALGVGYYPRQKLARTLDNNIWQTDLLSILYMMGIPGYNIVKSD